MKRKLEYGDRINLNIKEWKKLIKSFEMEDYIPIVEPYLKFIKVYDYDIIEITYEVMGDFEIYTCREQGTAKKDWHYLHTFNEDDMSFGTFLFHTLYYDEKEGKVKLASKYQLEEIMNCDALSVNTAIDSLSNFSDAIAGMVSLAFSSNAYNYTYNGSDSVSALDYHNCPISSAATTNMRDELEEIKEKINSLKEEKENNEMNFNLDFGSLKNKNNITLSIKGVCIKNRDNNWVAYDVETKELIAVDDFVLVKGNEYLYKVPVPLKDVKKGDILIHNGYGVYVEEINFEKETNKVKSLVVVSPAEGEVKEILPIKNMFNFEYITKVVNVFDMFGEKPNTDNPFGNMLPFLMMKDDNKNMKDILFIQTMMNEKDATSFNPMFFALMGDKDIDPMMLMMLGNMNK